MTSPGISVGEDRRDPELGPPAESVQVARDRLIAEGLRVFSTVGYDGASLRDIERRAGVGRSLVAHHFGTKDALWKECVGSLMSEFYQEMSNARRLLSAVSAVERARVMQKIYIRFVARHPEYPRLILLVGTDGSERMRWLVNAWRRSTVELFEETAGFHPKDAARHAAAHYAFVGAASYIFAVPEEVKSLFGVDPAEPQFAESFAELIVEWAGVAPSADGGEPDSALRRATKKTFGAKALQKVHRGRRRADD
jgi:TetR/AcrR family transcriptional regulator